MIETPMTRRFLRALWSPLRLAMDEMLDDEILTYPRETYKRGNGNYIHAFKHASRMHDAYEGQRTWVVRISPCRESFTIHHKLTPTN